MLTAARSSSDPISIATALVLDGLSHLTLRDTRMVAERVDEMVSIAAEHKNPTFLVMVSFFRGWALASPGA